MAKNAKQMLADYLSRIDRDTQGNRCDVTPVFGDPLAFGALVEDLVGALDQFKVPPREKNELLSMLAPMKSDIVGQ